MSAILDNARAIRAAILKGSEKLDDKDVSMAPDILKRLKLDGSLISAGTRINWNGVVKKSTVDLWDTEENNPDNAPALWEDIQYRDGHRIIPETITSTLAFAIDELGWWNDILYKSLINANVYNPDQYPAGWEVVSKD